ncbi:MAG: hypothetical protein ACM3KR_01025, partial [Deltaproteobacteria bacterium]
MMAEDSSTDIERSSGERNKILEEFNKLLDKSLAKLSTFQDLEQLGVQSVKMAALDNEGEAKGNVIDKKSWKYTHFPLDQRTVGENRPIAARMRQIAEIKVKNQSKETQMMQTLLLLVSQLRGSVKEEFMEKALDFVCNIQFGDLRAEILSNIIPALEGPRKVEFIKKAFYSASAIEDEKERALVFSSLSRHLSGSGNDELIAHIFEFSSFIEYDDSKFQILASLIPHLYGSEKFRSEEETERIINTALELVSGLISDFREIESYSMLLPLLKKQKKYEILGIALNLAFNLKDKDMKPEALSLIIPFMREPRKSEIIGEAFKLASEIKCDSRRSMALSSLAPYFE